MTQELIDIIESARQYRESHPLTDAERKEQMISFAYGNVAIENGNVTREMVTEEYERLYSRIV